MLIVTVVNTTAFIFHEGVVWHHVSRWKVKAFLACLPEILYNSIILKTTSKLQKCFQFCVRYASDVRNQHSVGVTSEAETIQNHTKTSKGYKNFSHYKGAIVFFTLEYCTKIISNSILHSWPWSHTLQKPWTSPLSLLSIVSPLPVCLSLFPCLFLSVIPWTVYSFLPVCCLPFWPCLPFDILSVCRLPRPLHCPCWWFCLAFVTPVLVTELCLSDLLLSFVNKTALGSQLPWPLLITHLKELVIFE